MPYEEAIRLAAMIRERGWYLFTIERKSGSMFDADEWSVGCSTRISWKDQVWITQPGYMDVFTEWAAALERSQRHRQRLDTEE